MTENPESIFLHVLDLEQQASSPLIPKDCVDWLRNLYDERVSKIYPLYHVSVDQDPRYNLRKNCSETDVVIRLEWHVGEYELSLRFVTPSHIAEWSWSTIGKPYTKTLVRNIDLDKEDSWLWIESEIEAFRSSNKHNLELRRFGRSGVSIPQENMSPTDLNNLLKTLQSIEARLARIEGVLFTARPPSTNNELVLTKPILYCENQVPVK
jgi:hypothetical protein